MLRQFPLLIFCLFYSAVASAQIDYIQVVINQFTEAVRSGGGNFRQGFLGHVNEGNYVTHWMRSNFGSQMLVRGFCDQDCDDMDLQIFDENDKLVVEDLDNDNVPAVYFDPMNGMSYKIRARMHNCRNNPCYYSVATFTN